MLAVFSSEDTDSGRYFGLSVREIRAKLAPGVAAEVCPLSLDVETCAGASATSESCPQLPLRIHESARHHKPRGSLL